MHANQSCHRRRRLSRVTSVRRVAAPRPSRDLRGQPRDGVARQHRAHPRQHVRAPQRRHHRALLHRRTDRLRLPPGVAGVADRLSAPASGHAQGRLVRHPPHAGPGQAAPRALPDRLDQRGVRRSEGPPPARDLLGAREPDRAARRVRRGQALCRGAHDGVPPPAGRGHRDRSDLQHIRSAHAPARRPRDPHLPAPGAPGPPDHRVRRRLPDPLILLRGGRDPGADRTRRVRLPQPGQRRQSQRVHAARAGPDRDRSDRLEVRDRVRGAADRRSPGAPAGHHAGARDSRLGAGGEPAGRPPADHRPGRDRGPGRGALRRATNLSQNAATSGSSYRYSRSGADVIARSHVDGRAERGREHPFKRRDAWDRPIAVARARRPAQEAAVPVLPVAHGDAAAGRAGGLAARARLHRRGRRAVHGADAQACRARQPERRPGLAGHQALDRVRLSDDRAGLRPRGSVRRPHAAARAGADRHRAVPGHGDRAGVRPGRRAALQ